MKQFFTLILLVVFGTTLSSAQPRGNGNGTGNGPKGNNGNHSNGNGPFNPPPGNPGNHFGFSNTNGFREESSSASSASSDISDPANANADISAAKAKGTTFNKTTLVPFVLGSSFMTPTAWGSSGTYVFGAAGGTPNQVYASSQRQPADMFAQVGFGTGDASKFVSIVGVVNVNDVSEVDNLSYSFSVSRNLGKFSSISAGALHLFADQNKTDAPPSYYIAYSQAIKNTKISYTIGAGTGRFYGKSPMDQYYEKGEHGTGVFANVSYNLLKNVAVSTEWTGTNLAFSSTVMIKPYLPVLSFGVSEVTRLTGDHPTFFAAIGKAFLLSKGRK
jgi:hypothetical protein